MGLFDEQIAFFQNHISRRQQLGRIRLYDPSQYADWPRTSTLVLEEDTAIELGNPKKGSLSLLLWSPQTLAQGDAIMLEGPDLDAVACSSAPFGQVVLVAGDFADAYETHRALREAVYATALEGFMTRVLPSRQRIWCRVARQAVRDGFSLAHAGSAVVRSIREATRVEAVLVLYVTAGRQELLALNEAARQVRRITGALVKMSEEASFDCVSCEYREVCETVEEIRELRKRRTEQRVG